MAINERIVTLTNKEDMLQDAPSKAGREQFKPGEASVASPNSDTRGGMNWPTEFPVKTGIPVIDNNGIWDQRVHLMGRNVICDVTIPAPVVTGTRIDTITDIAHGLSAINTVTETETQENDGSQERDTGWENINP